MSNHCALFIDIGALTMKKSLTVLSALLAFTLTAAGQASAHEGHAAHSGSMNSSAQSSEQERHYTKGVVKQVDASRGLIIIHHPPIESLDWEEMTMPFPIVNKGMLQGIKVDDKVELELIMPNDVATIDKITVVN